MTYSHWRDHKRAYTAAKNTYSAEKNKPNLDAWQKAVNEAANYLENKKFTMEIEKRTRRLGHIEKEKKAINDAKAALPVPSIRRREISGTTASAFAQLNIPASAGGATTPAVVAAPVTAIAMTPLKSGHSAFLGKSASAASTKPTVKADAGVVKSPTPGCS